MTNKPITQDEVQALLDAADGGQCTIRPKDYSAEANDNALAKLCFMSPDIAIAYIQSSKELEAKDNQLTIAYMDGIAEGRKQADRQIDELKAQLIVANGALRTFADCCDQIADDEDDDEWAKFRLEIGDYRRAKNALAETPQQSLQAHDDVVRNSAIDEFIAQLEAIESPPTMRKTGKAGDYTCEQEAAFDAGVQASIEKLKSKRRE